MIFERGVAYYSFKNFGQSDSYRRWGLFDLLFCGTVGIGILLVETQISCSFDEVRMY